MTDLRALLRSSASRHLHAWLRREDGVVTVDYVVLSAAVIGLGLAIHAVLDDPLTDVAHAVEGELSETDTTDEAGDYRPFDPQGWEALLADTRNSWKTTTETVTVTVEVDGGGDEIATETVVVGPSPDEIHDAMRDLLTIDEYAVLIGDEDAYAALQIVMEENGYDLPDGWPDYRAF